MLSLRGSVSSPSIWLESLRMMVVSGSGTFTALMVSCGAAEAESVGLVVLPLEPHADKNTMPVMAINCFMFIRFCFAKSYIEMLCQSFVKLSFSFAIK